MRSWARARQVGRKTNDCDSSDCKTDKGPKDDRERACRIGSNWTPFRGNVRYLEDFATAAHLIVEALELLDSWLTLTRQLMVNDPKLDPADIGMLCTRVSAATSIRVGSMSAGIEAALLTASLGAPDEAYAAFREITRTNAPYIAELGRSIAVHDFALVNNPSQFLSSFESVRTSMHTAQGLLCEIRTLQGDGDAC